MRLFTRYVLREVGLIFLVTLFALTTFMLLVGAVQVAMAQGLGAKQIILALPYLLPNALMFAMPGTMLFAVSMVYGRMSAANELVALKSMGISPMLLIWPSLAMSVVLSLATVWLNDLAMNWGFFGLQQVVVDSVEEIAYGILRTQKTYKDKAGQLEVTVKDVVDKQLIEPKFRLPAGNGEGMVDISAKTAELRSVPGSGKLKLVLYHAILDAPNFHAEYPNEFFEWEVMIQRDERKEPAPKNLAMRDIPEAAQRQREVIAQLSERMVAQAGTRILLGDFELVSPEHWREEARNLEFQRFQLYRMLTEPPRRWANGFSCFCFALVGTAMAIRMRNADVLTSFALCFFPIFLVYYPLLMLGLERAKAGEVYPAAVWLANVILVIWGLWLLRRVIRY